jgi:hypothetical protein
MDHPNKQCIRIETHIFNKSMFETSIDATYIMHLEDNGRINSINEQLQEFQPSNYIHIVFNKGYTKCKKSLYLQEPAYDLVDTLVFIFQDAKKKGYENILVLEDDFIFSEEIKKSNHLNNINLFLREKKNENMMYSLGCLSWLQLPYNIHTNINLLSTGTHSVIYTNTCRNHFLNQNMNKISDLDIFQNFHLNTRRYVYHLPLCYQLFPPTENSNKWPSFFGFNPIKIYIKYSELDIKPENGFSNTYIFAKILGYLLLCFIIYIIIISCIIFYRYIKKNNFYKFTRKK